LGKIINLVTGGAGFIGTHLINYLLNKGEYVISMDNLMTGSNENNNLFLNNSNFDFIYHDVTIPVDIFANKIWHLASPASPRSYQKNPILTSKINFLGTLNMLELAKKYNSRFLITSTSEVYGKTNFSKQDENNNGYLDTKNERSCYFESKRIAETLSFDFARKYNVDVKVTRIFNTYGPYMTKNDGRVINNMILQGLRNEDLTIYGTGNQKRTFCYITDIIEGIYRLMNSDIKGPINLGSEEDIKIKELAHLITHKLNIPRKFSYCDISPSEPLKRKPSIALAKKYLNWEPNVTLDIGLEKTINYCKKHNFKKIDG